VWRNGSLFENTSDVEDNVAVNTKYYSAGRVLVLHSFIIMLLESIISNKMYSLPKNGQIIPIETAVISILANLEIFSR
jgi:hypothetical protein